MTTATTSALDWSQCPAVESIPGKCSAAWVFKDTRTPVSVVFDNLQDMSVEELVEEFGVTREQVKAVLQGDCPTPPSPSAPAPRCCTAPRTESFPPAPPDRAR